MAEDAGEIMRDILTRQQFGMQFDESSLSGNDVHF